MNRIRGTLGTPVPYDDVGVLGPHARNLCELELVVQRRGQRRSVLHGRFRIEIGTEQTACWELRFVQVCAVLHGASIVQVSCGNKLRSLGVG
jgi:hypothetical protein